ncbi:MAG: DUF3987 domain-containing protein [Bacteroidales bacterium]|nr:DUF3987 domain-containing protein [Bacteroidales bacterium]
MLYATSVSIGNAVHAEVKVGWRESAVLYIAIVGRPGTNKSSPLSFAVQPLIEHDIKTYQYYQSQLKEFDEAARLTEKERKQLGMEMPDKPVWQKILLSDYTPEALAEVHSFKKRGIGVCVDELAGWFKNFNKYNKGSEMEFWLSAWSRKPITIDRKTAEPIFIPLPFISVAGTIQTGIIKELGKENRTENGFLDRILIVIPDNLLKPYWNETELNPNIIGSWHSIISNLLALKVQLDETHNPKPQVLTFNTDAKRILWEWQKDNADQCNNSRSDAISGIYSKLEIYAIRLSLIFELLSWACGESNINGISASSVRSALKLVEYFKRSAIKVHSNISSLSPLDKLPADKQNLYEALPLFFTTEAGLKIANDLGVPVRTFKRFLNEQELFTHLSKGKYEKRIK